jgi:hypothetical protein
MGGSPDERSPSATVEADPVRTVRASVMDTSHTKYVALSATRTARRGRYQADSADRRRSGAHLGAKTAG